MAITFPSPTQLKNGLYATDPGDFVTKGQADNLYRGVRFDVTNASASWVIIHGLDRTPSVTVYLDTGEQVLADVLVTTTAVNVIFAAARTGFIIAA